jgi:hypothetical protein
MRKVTALLLVLCLSAATAFAGDVNTPGKTDPPPCTENCVVPAASEPLPVGTADTIGLFLLELALLFIKK